MEHCICMNNNAYEITFEKIKDKDEDKKEKDRDKDKDKKRQRQRQRQSAETARHVQHVLYSPCWSLFLKRDYMCSSF